MSTRRGFFGRMAGLLAAGVPVAASAAPEFQMPVTPAAITVGAFDDADGFLRQFEYGLYTPPLVLLNQQLAAHRQVVLQASKQSAEIASKIATHAMRSTKSLP